MVQCPLNAFIPIVLSYLMVNICANSLLKSSFAVFGAVHLSRTCPSVSSSSPQTTQGRQELCCYTVCSGFLHESGYRSRNPFYNNSGLDASVVFHTVEPFLHLVSLMIVPTLLHFANEYLGRCTGRHSRSFLDNRVCCFIGLTSHSGMGSTVEQPYFHQLVISSTVSLFQ